MNGALLTAWHLWDTIYYSFSRLVYVDKQNHNIFRVVTKRYAGDTLRAGSQDVISTGDYYVKLHIHNYQLARCLRGLRGEMQLGLSALKEVRNSLPALARYVSEHPEADNIAGIVGTTFLYRGAEPLGFHIQDIDSPVFCWFKTAFFKLILSLCHPNGLKRVRYKADKLVAKRVFMSKKELLERYLGN